MATKTLPAPSQESVSQSVVAALAAITAGSTAEQLEAQKLAAQRESVINSLSYGELFTLISKRARWNDVLTAADDFAKFVTEAAKSETKATAIARKAANVSPSDAMALRFALCSYSLSKHAANKTQLAELASKLPQLEDNGALRDRKLTFGGIVLPPLAGEM